MRVVGPFLVLVAALAATGCERALPTPGRAADAGHERGAALPAAFAARCETLPPAPPAVTAEPVAPRFDESRSLADLTGMYERATPGHETLGLTHAELGYASSLAARGLRDGSRACMRVKVDVRMSMAPVIVFMAREIAADPCRREAVLAHEMRHVEVHAGFLRDAPDRLLALLDAADTGRVRIGADAEIIQQDAAREVSAIVAAAEATDRATLAALQTAVDTPEEYAQVSGKGGRSNGSCDTTGVAVPVDGARDASDRRRAHARATQ